MQRFSLLSSSCVSCLFTFEKRGHVRFPDFGRLNRKRRRRRRGRGDKLETSFKKPGEQQKVATTKRLTPLLSNCSRLLKGGGDSKKNGMGGTRIMLNSVRLLINQKKKSQTFCGRLALQRESAVFLAQVSTVCVAQGEPRELNERWLCQSCLRVHSSVGHPFYAPRFVTHVLDAERQVRTE